MLTAEQSGSAIGAASQLVFRRVSNVPHFIGRVICQRSNYWWDSKLRRAYRFLPLSSAIWLIAVVTVAAVAQRATMVDFVLGFLAPALPIVLWGIREARAQAEAADRADRLEELRGHTVEPPLRGDLAAETTGPASREFQDEILAHRRQSPLVFDWFYSFQKAGYERQMGSRVDSMVEEARGAGFDEPTRTGVNRA